MMTSNLFNTTKILVKNVISENLYKDSDEVWKLIKERFSDVPQYILVDCLKELDNE